LAWPLPRLSSQHWLGDPVLVLVLVLCTLS
jgi:hypothetical protein